jgi:DNA polymerase-3 subunit gamma/tau
VHGTVAGVEDRVNTSAPLAARWRPNRFADVVGQKAPVAVLRAGVLSPDPPRQLLLAGGSGLGKTTLGRIYAAALCCEDPPGDGDSCGHCESCQLIATGSGGSHPDVIEIDAASAGGKEEIIRLAASARVAPIRGSWRVWVIDEAHGVSKAGVDAFLKLLEEPPPGVVFVLATTEVDKMPATLRGRCLELRLAAPSPAELVGNVERVATGEGWTLPEGAAELVVDATDPELGVRGTLSTLGRIQPVLSSGADVDLDTVAEILGVVPAAEVTAVLTAISARDRHGALAALRTMIDHHSEPAARRRLLAAAVDALHAADATSVEAATRVATLLADASAGASGLSVAVARAAAPDPGNVEDLAELTERLAATVSDARAVLDELTAHDRSSAATTATTATTATAAATPPAATTPPAPEAPAPARAPRPATRTVTAPSPDGDPGPSEPPPPEEDEGPPRWADAEAWFADPATSSTAPPEQGRRSPGPARSNDSRRPRPEQSTPAEQGTRPAAAQQSSAKGDKKRAKPTKPLAGGSPTGSADQVTQFASVLRRDYPSGWDLVIRHSDVSDLGDRRLQIVIPADKTDTAKIAGFRDPVEAAAAVCGFDTVVWKAKRPAPA